MFLNASFFQVFENFLFIYFDTILDQIIPQAICSRYGLSVGANFVWLVRILMIVCYPIAYPIGKVVCQL